MLPEDYFAPIAQELFSHIMLRLGAEVGGVAPLSVRFEARDWFVELFALASDGPRYSPRVDIGPLPEIGLLSRDNQVDIMHTVPEGSPLRRYNLDWIYRDPAEMRNAFSRARDEIFVPYAIPLLSDQGSLKRLVAKRSREIGEQWKAEVEAHNDGVYRAKAQQAAAAEDYRGYLEHMRKIPSERLTKAERARVKYSEKLV